MSGAPSSDTPIAEISTPYPPTPLSQVLLYTTAPLPQPSEIFPPILPPSTYPPAAPSGPGDASSDCPAYGGPLPLSHPPRTTESTVESSCVSPPLPPSPESNAPLAATTTMPAIAGSNPPLSLVYTARKTLLPCVFRLSSTVCPHQPPEDKNTKIKQIAWIGIILANNEVYLSIRRRRIEDTI